MTSIYTPTAQRALATITRKGSLGTFAVTSGTPVFDPSTNTWTNGTPGTAPFRAVQTKNDQEQLATLGLLQRTVITLLIAASGLSVVPTPKMTLTWAGVSYTIDDAPAVAPDGVPILFTVVASV